MLLSEFQDVPVTALVINYRYNIAPDSPLVSNFSRMESALRAEKRPRTLRRAAAMLSIKDYHCEKGWTIHQGVNDAVSIEEMSQTTCLEFLREIKGERRDIPEFL